MKAKKMKLLAYLAKQTEAVTFRQIPEEVKSRFDQEGPDNLYLVLERLREEKIIHSDVPGTWLITDKGHQALEKHYKSRFPIYYKAVLHYLADYCHDFTPVSQVLQQLDVPDEDGTLAAMIEKKLVKKDLVFTFAENGVLINENGRQRAVQQRQGWQEKETEAALQPEVAVAEPIASVTSAGKQEVQPAAVHIQEGNIRHGSAGSFSRLLGRILNRVTGQGMQQQVQPSKQQATVFN